MNIILSAAAVAAIAVAGLWWLRRRWVMVVVRGQSMAPTFRSGERVLARRPGRTGIRNGDVVVFHVGPSHVADDPAWRVKRVAAIEGDALPAWYVSEGHVPARTLVVAGDNSGSQDSRQLGLIPVDSVIGVIHREPVSA